MQVCSRPAELECGHCGEGLRLKAADGRRVVAEHGRVVRCPRCAKRTLVWMDARETVWKGGRYHG